MTTQNRELASLIDNSGNVTATGNLTVSGTTTTISSTVQTIADPLIELNTGAGSNSNDLGFVFERGSTGNNACLIWDESADAFAVGTTTATGTSTGNMSYTVGDFLAGKVTVDNVIINGTTIGHTDDTDLMTLADGALTVAGTIASTGVVTANAGVVVDNITIDGTEIDLSSGDLTLDVAGDIILDADGGDFKFRDGGTNIGYLSNSSSDFAIEAQVQDKDIIFKGNDNGSGITALTLDMSEAGDASFNRNVGIGTSSPSSYNSNAENLVVRDSGNVGITLSSGASSDCFVAFANGEDTGIHGLIQYDHNSDAMHFRTNDVDSRITIDSAGKVGIGNASPSYEMHIKKAASETSLAIQSNISPTGSSVGGRLRLQLGAQSNSGSGNADTSAGDFCGQVLFEGQGTDYSYQAGSVNCLVTTGDGNDGRSNQGAALTFGTMAVGATSQVEKMRLSEEGFLGVGVDAPAFLGLTGSGTSRVLHVGGTNAQLRLTNSIIHHDNAGLTKLTIRNNYGATSNSAQMELQAGFITFETGTSFTERLRINSSGRQTFNSSGTANAHATYVGEVGVSSKALAFEHTVGGGEVGTIVTGSSSTTYNTSSDYRLKENVDYTWDATTRLKQLKPARFNWIADDTNTLLDGFLAHEVSSIVPEAVVGEKDGMADAILYEAGDEIPSGKKAGDVKTAPVPEYQGIDHSKLVPLLVKTIQELEARITTLEG